MSTTSSELLIALLIRFEGIATRIEKIVGKPGPKVQEEGYKIRWKLNSYIKGAVKREKKMLETVEQLQLQILSLVRSQTALVNLIKDGDQNDSTALKNFRFKRQ